MLEKALHLRKQLIGEASLAYAQVSIIIFFKNKDHYRL